MALNLALNNEDFISGDTSYFLVWHFVLLYLNIFHHKIRKKLLLLYCHTINFEHVSFVIVLIYFDYQLCLFGIIFTTCKRKSYPI